MNSNLISYVAKVDKFGIRNIEVWVNKYTGRIETAFPISRLGGCGGKITKSRPKMEKNIRWQKLKAFFI